MNTKKMKNQNLLGTLMRVIDNWFPVVLWGTVIFVFSSYPTHGTTQIHWQDFIIKKSAHIVFFGTFATLVYRALLGSKVVKKIAGYTSVAATTLYGVSDEFHQSFTPGREPTLRDIIIDTIGAVLAIYIIWKVLPKLNGKIKDLASKFRIIN